MNVSSKRNVRSPWPLICLGLAFLVGGLSLTTSDLVRAAHLLGQVNNPPIANDDSYTVRHDDDLNIDATGGVLANDSDPDGDALTLVPSPPASGALNIDANGAFTYTPAAGFVGVDSFVYTLFDDGVPQLSDDATVTITVYDIPPVAVDDTYTMSQDTVLNIDATGGLLANDSDPDFDTLTIIPGPPTSGSISIDVNGAFTYTPFAGFAGTDSFVYTIVESGTIGLSDDATVTILVVGPSPTATAEPDPTIAPNPTDGPVATPTPGSSGGVTELPSTGGAPFSQSDSMLFVAALVALALAGTGLYFRRRTRPSH